MVAGSSLTTVSHFAEMACPLYLHGRDDKIEATPELRQQFQKMPEALATAPVLRLPRLDRPFILESDASSFAVGAVLKQSDENGEYPYSSFPMASPRPREIILLMRESFSLSLKQSPTLIFICYIIPLSGGLTTPPCGIYSAQT